MLLSRAMRLFREHFLEEIRRPSGRIRSDLCLFLPDLQKQAIQRFLGHVAVQVEGIHFHKRGHRRVAVGQHLVGVGYTDLIHAVGNDGFECLGELKRGFGLEVVGGGSVAAVQDLLGILEVHILNGVVENRLGLGRRLLSRPVHAQDKIGKLHQPLSSIIMGQTLRGGLQVLHQTINRCAPK